MSKQRDNYFYQQLVPFLIGAYPDTDTDKAKLLGECAFSYLKVLLVVDSVIDDKDSNAMALIDAIALHEKVIRDLCELIPQSDIFWDRFDKLKKQYAKTVLAEKQLSATKDSFSEEVFEALAYGKSAVCLAIAQGLQSICPNHAPISVIESALKHIHIAFQYLDDVTDFKKDITQNQWTYPQFLLQNYFADNTLTITAADTQHKYLFLSGIAENMIDKAVYHYQIALDYTSQLQLQELRHYLEKQIEAAQFYQNEIKLLIEKTKIKSEKSRKVKTSITPINNTIDEGLNFILKNANDGLWTDFMTSAGHGKTWISGYVGMMLAEVMPELPILQKTLQNISDKGSFNENILQDADSTTFLIGLYQAMNQQLPQGVFDQWLAFQNKEGGWATYRDEKTLRRTLDLDDDIGVEGWFQPHGCVSAAAAYIINRSLMSGYDKTHTYINHLTQNDLLTAYWWTSDVYSQAFGLMAMAENDTPTKQKLINSLKQQQAQEGYWINPQNQQPNAFYTAIALKALTPYEPEVAKTAIWWLMKNQTTDGSWQTDRILRIPATDVTNPKTVSHWRQSSFGVNALSDDYNRVFTTATVVNALCGYGNNS